MIPGFVKAEVELILGGYLGKNCSVISAGNVSGGCINDCYCLNTDSGKYFLKFNNASRYPEMFIVEAEGLHLMEKAVDGSVPLVIAVGEANEISFLLLEWIEPGTRGINFWPDFGKLVAEMHKCSNVKFGLKRNNYIGSLAQSNLNYERWVDFFIQERLEPQIRVARDNGLISNAIMNQFQNLYLKLGEIIPEEKPALLHGDLWNGNFLVNKTGGAMLIDPAVYYGHREMDLAMTKLFGGFDAEFYKAYEEHFPIKEGFETRIDIHNLYPLMVHVNLFGGGYMEQVVSILNKFN